MSMPIIRPQINGPSRISHIRDGASTLHFANFSRGKPPQKGPLTLPESERESDVASKWALGKSNLLLHQTGAKIKEEV